MEAIIEMKRIDENEKKNRWCCRKKVEDGIKVWEEDEEERNVTK